MSEQEIFENDVKQMYEWWKSDRFALVKRPYSAQEGELVAYDDNRSVVSKRGTLHIEYPSNVQAKKLWGLLKKHYLNKTFSHTYGALDPVQGSAASS